MAHGNNRQVFMAVQKAFDTLTDVTKRRAYDSSLEFDDSIPGELHDKEKDICGNTIPRYNYTLMHCLDAKLERLSSISKTLKAWGG